MRYVSGGNAMAAYSFTYNTDQINHLAGITNTFGTSENYTVSISANHGLFSPFTNTTACGSTNTNCGYAGFLDSVTRTGVNLTTPVRVRRRTLYTIYASDDVIEKADSGKNERARKLLRPAEG
jgi:hypothetical protein